MCMPRARLVEIFFDFPAVLFGSLGFYKNSKGGKRFNTMQRVAYMNIYIMM